MSNVLGLFVSVSIWILSFKPFLKNKDGFIKSFECLVKGGRLYSWKWDDHVGSDIKAAIKFILWFALGGSTGYLVIYLMNL